MPEANQILQILLRVQADVADLGKVTAGLKEVEAQAVETSAAVNGASTSGAVSSAAGPAGVNQTQLNSEILALQQSQAEIMAQILGTSTGVVAANAEDLTIQERITASSRSGRSSSISASRKSRRKRLGTRRAQRRSGLR